MKTKHKLYLPERLKDFTSENLFQASSYDFEQRNLSRDTEEELFDLRLSGLSTLQFFKKELMEFTEEDLDWYIQDLAKEGLYDREEDRRIIRRSRPVPGKNYMDLTESNDYMKDCYKEEKKDMMAYIIEYKKELTEKYPLEVSEWFTGWYFFWGDHPTLTRQDLDWGLYFSSLNPRLPDILYVRFSEIIQKFNTIRRAELTPVYLKWCWENLEIRKKVLKGELFRNNDYICPYSTVFSYIHKREGTFEEKVPILNLDEVKI